MAHWSNAANYETGMLAYEIGIGFVERLVHQLSCLPNVDAIRTTSNDEQRFAGAFPPEYNRFGDLLRRAADRIRCRLCRSGIVRKLNDSMLVPKLPKRPFYPLYTLDIGL